MGKTRQVLTAAGLGVLVKTLIAELHNLRVVQPRHIVGLNILGLESPQAQSVTFHHLRQ